MLSCCQEVPFRFFFRSLLPFVIFSLVTPVLSQFSWPQTMNFRIASLWDGTPLPSDEYINLEVTPMLNKVRLKVDAPFYNDSAIPQAQPGSNFPNLWKHEVVEFFFLSGSEGDGKYLEVELSPHGLYWVLLLNGYRNTVAQDLPITFSSQLTEDCRRWTGVADIPYDYFPPNVCRFNAYAIHGADPSRQYLSLYPADDTLTEPDFHALQFFEEVNLGEKLKENTVLSKTWQEALEQ